MKPLSPRLRWPLAPNVLLKGFTGFSGILMACLIALFGLGGLSSCQRAPQAYFAPTHHPAAQRAATSPLSLRPTADSLTTASRDESVPLATKPVWRQTTTSVPEPTDRTSVGQPWLKQQHRRLRFGKATPPTCDQIVLRNGDVVEAKVKEVGVSEIRYKKCDRPDGPDYTISKRDVLSIKYTNGEVERFSSVANSSSSNNSNRQSNQSPTNQADDGPRTDPFAIVAIAAGGLAIFGGLSGSILLGAAAVVFGALSLGRIRKEPNRFKGKGLAMAGMIAGIVAAASILLYVYVF